MTFQELLIDAIKYDEEKLAYSIYWLIKNGIVKSTDFADNVDWDLVNHDEVIEMRKRNELNMNPIKLYSSPIGNNKHILVFAKDEQSAKFHIKSEIGFFNGKLFDITYEMDKDFWFPEKNKYLSLRELKDENTNFPATAMIFEK